MVKGSLQGSRRVQRKYRTEEFRAEVAVTRRMLRARTLGFFDPNSDFIRRWDVSSLVALAFVAIVTPYELAFIAMPEGTARFNLLFFLNRFVDLFFLIDIGFQFFLPYKDKIAGWIFDRRAVVIRYAKSWLIIDLVASIPYDLLTARNAKVLRVLRLFKAVKVLRVVRSAAIFKRWESRMSIRYSQFTIIKCIIFCFLLTHWMACLWGLTAVMEDNVDRTWICNSEFRCNNIPGFEDVEGKWEGGNLWVVSVYWAAMTITSVGYGDILPSTVGEYCIATFVILVGAFIWAYIVGVMCGVVSAFNPHEVVFRSQLDELNQHMKDYNFPMSLRVQLRDYFQAAKILRLKERNMALFSSTSPVLQTEVHWIMNNEWVGKVSYFKLLASSLSVDQNREFTGMLYHYLDTTMYAPREFLPSARLSIIQKGVAARFGRILTQGSTWGEDMMLHNASVGNKAAAVVALSYVELASLSPGSLQEMMSRWPTLRKTVRSAAIRAALKNKFLEIASRESTTDNLINIMSGNESSATNKPLIAVDSNHNEKLAEASSTDIDNSKIEKAAHPAKDNRGGFFTMGDKISIKDLSNTTMRKGGAINTDVMKAVASLTDIIRENSAKQQAQLDLLASKLKDLENIATGTSRRS